MQIVCLLCISPFLYSLTCTTFISSFAFVSFFASESQTIKASKDLPRQHLSLLSFRSRNFLVSMDPFQYITPYLGVRDYLYLPTDKGFCYGCVGNGTCQVLGTIFSQSGASIAGVGTATGSGQFQLPTGTLSGTGESGF